MVKNGSQCRKNLRYFKQSRNAFGMDSYSCFLRVISQANLQWQTYDFIADKSCSLFSIILNVLSGWDVIRTQGKSIKSYKNFWKDFVVEQNLTHPNGNFWSYLIHTRLYGQLDDWEYGSLFWTWISILGTFYNSFGCCLASQLPNNCKNWGNWSVKILASHFTEESC